jgi:hypothetical protein
MQTPLLIRTPRATLPHGRPNLTGNTRTGHPSALLSVSTRCLVLTTHSFCRTKQATYPVICTTWRQYLSCSQQLPHTSRRHGGCTPPPFPTFRRSDLQTCQLFCLQRLSASLPSFANLALCFQWFAASFCKTPGVGVCPQPRHLKSTRCRLFACALAPLSGPSEGRAQSAAHYPPLTTHSPVPPHSVLNSWLSCPEAGQP